MIYQLLQPQEPEMYIQLVYLYTDEPILCISGWWADVLTERTVREHTEAPTGNIIFRQIPLSYRVQSSESPIRFGNLS